MGTIKERETDHFETLSVSFLFCAIVAGVRLRVHNIRFPALHSPEVCEFRRRLPMSKNVSAFIASLCCFICIAGALAQDDASDKARVFITDSQSWEVSGGGGGSAAGFGGASHGGARPQTAEIVKTFGERCPDVVVNNIQEKTDYIVLLDHEGGKSILQHKNKVAVFARVSGDSVVSKSTLSLGGSVQEACEAIRKDWAAHGAAIRAAVAASASKAAVAQPAAAASPAPATPAGAKLSIVSIPDGADIEIDGSFVGNAPSDLQLPEGEHTIAVKKTGFKDWERKMKVNGGSNIHLNAELEKVAAQ